MDKISQEHQSWNMSRIHSKDTSPEILLRSLLFRKGYRFRKNVNALPRKPDIVLKKYNTVIFVHGCFWHSHEGCSNSVIPKTRTEFWCNKFQVTIKRDKKIIKELKDSGWNVIIVWKCQLKKNCNDIIEQIEKKLFEGTHG